MKKRQLGNSDLFVSEVGLGCMSLGTNEAEALRILDAAFAEGINFLDTADLYHYGLNEEIVGKAIRNRRADVVLATKVGNRWTDEKDGWFWDPSKAYIKEEVKESLRRLGTDYIDLYQLHGGTIEDNIEETIQAFDELQQEGVIRYYGISSIRPNVIREYVKHSKIVSILMEYSILNRRPEELFPLLKKHHVSVIARGPVAKGLLTNNNAGKLEHAREKGYLSYRYEELKHTLQLVQAAAPHRPLEEIAVQYCLHDSVVASIIPGASSIEHIRANANAGQAAPLTAQEYARIQSAAKQDLYELHR